MDRGLSQVECDQLDFLPKEATVAQRRLEHSLILGHNEREGNQHSNCRSSILKHHLSPIDRLNRLLPSRLIEASFQPPVAFLASNSFSGTIRSRIASGYLQ